MQPFLVPPKLSTSTPTFHVSSAGVQPMASSLETVVGRSAKGNRDAESAPHPSAGSPGARALAFGEHGHSATMEQTGVIPSAWAEYGCGPGHARVGEPRAVHVVHEAATLRHLTDRAQLLQGVPARVGCQRQSHARARGPVACCGPFGAGSCRVYHTTGVPAEFGWV